MADPNEEETHEQAEQSIEEPIEQEPAPENRAAKRAASNPQEIRDRNRRIREEAAQKRRGKRESQRRAAPARNLDTSEIVDDALARSTHLAGNWLKQNVNVLQWVVLAAVVGGIGYQIYSYRQRLNAASATDELVKGVLAENGRVGEGESAPDPYTGIVDVRPSFANDEARLKAASSAYGQVANQSGASGTFAALGLAGVLFDQGKFKEAEAEYTKVKDSATAAKDHDVRGRAIEGIGLSREAQKQIDPALAAFRELANTDYPGFNTLGEYHQARLLFAKGEREQAKALLKKAFERVNKANEDKKAPAAPAGEHFLEQQIRNLLAAIDPTAVPKPASTGMSSEQMRRLQQQIQQLTGGNGKLDPEQLKELMSKMRGQGAPAPMPAPVDSPEPAGSSNP